MEMEHVPSPSSLGETYNRINRCRLLMSAGLELQQQIPKT